MFAMPYSDQIRHRSEMARCAQKQAFLLALRVIPSDIIQLRDADECALNR